MRSAICSSFAVISLSLSAVGVAEAQDSAGVFLQGDCPRQGSAPDLSSVVSEPDTPAALRSRPLGTPRFALQKFYRGRVVVAFVVSAEGRVEPGTSVILESTDPRLSVWACESAPRLRYRPALSAGTPVRSQVAMPMQFTAFVLSPP